MFDGLTRFLNGPGVYLALAITCAAVIISGYGGEPYRTHVTITLWGCLIMGRLTSGRG